MRKQQSTIARDYLDDAMLVQDETFDAIEEISLLIKEKQLAALNDGIRIGMEAAINDMRKNVARWLTLSDENLRVLAQEFVKSFNTGGSRNE